MGGDRVELANRSLWSSLVASGFESDPHHEGVAQLLMRLTTRNLEEAVRAQ